MKPKGKNSLNTSLLFGMIFSLGVTGAFSLAAFAIHKNFQGRLGLKVKDWVQVDFQGSPESKPSLNSSPAPVQTKDETKLP